jgi:hypothetical protein
VETACKGVGHKKLRGARDGLLTAGKLVNIGMDENGQKLALNLLEDRKPARLYVADDPTVRHLRPVPGTDGAQTVVPLFPEAKE